jgi:hypothetical protein
MAKTPWPLVFVLFRLVLGAGGGDAVEREFGSMIVTLSFGHMFIVSKANKRLSRPYLTIRRSVA